MKGKYLIISVLFIVSLTLTGCKGDKSDLEGYMNNNPTAKTNIEQTVSGMSTEDMETNISFEGNTVVVTETLNTTYSDRMAKKMKEMLEEMPEDSFSGAIRDLEKTSGISGVNLKIVLKNGDGTDITERSYR